MKITKDKLSELYKYPCTISEIKNYLSLLPKSDLKGIKSIRLSNQKTNIDGGYLHNGRIEIIYFVDTGCRKPIYGFLTEETIRDTIAFGGRLEVYNGKQYICWTHRELKRYIQFILYHEVGHHVYEYQYGVTSSNSSVENFCNEYAYKYLKKT